MKRKYLYFVAYSYNTVENIGTGEACIARRHKIDSQKDILNVMDFIKNHNGFQGVVITNIILLKKSWFKDLSK